MLNPNNDRLDYGNILEAPPNYELDFAIGTTYSLDLDSLVGASIALGLSEETDTVLIKNPIFLLEALRSTGDKIALFCENGKIRFPPNPSKLYILLEQMVFQVNAPKKEHITKYPSFHPKFWLIRYENENKEVIYRIVVLSRNLTFDRSWDISFTMDGKYVKNSSNPIKEKNKNLVLFLEYLKEFCTDSDKSDKIDNIVAELNDVEFELNSNTFVDFDFIPNGVNDDVTIEKCRLCTVNDFDDLVIISPFLSKKIIRHFNKRAKNNKSYQKSINGPDDSRLYLFTRLNSLSKLDYDDCNEFKIYTLKEEIINGESIISEESNNSVGPKDNGGSFSDENEEVQYPLQNIHAKIYYFKKGSQVDLYLGSLNASHNAFFGNVEFMIHLKTTSRRFKLENLLNDLFCGDEGEKENPFRRVYLNETTLVEELEDKVKKDLDSILKDIVHLNFKSKIIFDNNFYKINLNVDNFYIFENKNYGFDFSVSISPLFYNGYKIFSKDMSFERLEKLQLSTFFVIKIECDNYPYPIKKIIKIETEGMPKDRENDVFSSIVDNETAFMKYVAFLLADNPTEVLAKEEEIKSPKETHAKSSSLQFPEVYEKMLDAAANHPEKFKEINYLINILPEKVIPYGFEELYNTFKESLDVE